MSAQPQLPFRPPQSQRIVDKNTGELTTDWFLHIQYTAQQLKTPANQPAPVSSSAPGQFGQMALDRNGNLYIHVGTKWMKVQLVNF